MNKYNSLYFEFTGTILNISLTNEHNFLFMENIQREKFMNSVENYSLKKKKNGWVWIQLVLYDLLVHENVSSTIVKYLSVFVRAILSEFPRFPNRSVLCFQWFSWLMLSMRHKNPSVRHNGCVAWANIHVVMRFFFFGEYQIKATR